ncbi:MAG: hypothetical protein WCB73_21230, partial [Pseudonocardiaceae bacterium]
LGPTNLGPTNLGPTNLGPTNLGPTNLGPTNLGAIHFGGARGGVNSLRLAHYALLSDVPGAERPQRTGTPVTS